MVSLLPWATDLSGAPAFQTGEGHRFCALSLTLIEHQEEDG
jgi:hypothetical protein